MTAATAVSTWDEERREVWESVREAMDDVSLDEDRAAACAYLLRHLSAARPGSLPTAPQGRFNWLRN